jgi:3'(2'), 5'-bisphosphate nucleotidase
MMEQELQTANELAVVAGKLLLDHYQRTPEVAWKHGGDPVTRADRLASEFLVGELSRRFPADGVISEEQPGDPGRPRNSRVWIIDPMDGTREFIEHRGEFAVMIGLAVAGAPVLGVIYQPVTGKLYWARSGSGAFLKEPVCEENGVAIPLRVSREADPSRMTIALSRSHHSPEIDKVSRRLMIAKSISSGSIGLKVGLICEGRAHLYLDMSGRTSQWDTCAPAALLQEAGGRMTDLRGIPLRYNGPDLRNRNGVIASNGTIHDRVVEAVSHV